MRPRVFPAEDGSGYRGLDLWKFASMRPRVFPAEDIRYGAQGAGAGIASMRPRVFPAEDMVWPIKVFRPAALQ